MSICGSPRPVLSPVPVARGQENRPSSAPGVPATHNLFEKLKMVATQKETNHRATQTFTKLDEMVPVFSETAKTRKFAEIFLGVAKEAALRGIHLASSRKELPQLSEDFVRVAKQAAQEGSRLLKISEKNERLRSFFPKLDQLREAVLSNNQQALTKLQPQKKSEFDEQTESFLKQVVSLDSRVVSVAYAYFQGNTERLELLLQNVGDKEKLINAFENRNIVYLENRHYGANVL